MIGSSAATYRLGETVIKVPRIITEESEISQSNAKAAVMEANVYSILGSHERIAKCHYISPTKHMIQLEYYPHGNLRDYVAAHFRSTAQLLK